MSTDNNRSFLLVWLAIVLLALVGTYNSITEESNNDDQQETITDLKQCVLRMAGLDYFPEMEPKPGGYELDNDLIAQGACPLPGGEPVRVVPNYNEEECALQTGMIWDDESQSCAFTGMPSAPD